EPVAGDDPRVADAGDAAEARQLGPEAAGRVSLGVRLQRSGREPRLPAAERAAARRGARAGLTGGAAGDTTDADRAAHRDADGDHDLVAPRAAAEGKALAGAGSGLRQPGLSDIVGA